MSVNDTYCMCIVRNLRPETIRVWPAVLEFSFSLIISICGVSLNFMFLKKLKLERKNKPSGRKGNVIEPIMRWFCVIQIGYWPCELLMLSQIMGIAKISSMIPSLCPILFWSIVLGRTIIAYNSVFVALIRYVYIVHERKANQWDFEIVGRRFQIASISTPIIHMIILSFTMRKSLSQGMSPNTHHCSHATSVLISFTSRFVSDQVADVIAIICLVMMVLVYLNLVEGYLYIKIFHTIQR